MSIPADAWPVIGSISAGMVAGLVSFIVTILTKEQKTSEFRQAWVDALRQELSEFAAALISIADSIRLKQSQAGTKADLKDFLLNERFAEVKKLEELRVRMLLRLNPNEHTVLIGLIERAYAYSPARDQPHAPEGDRLVTEFVAESQRVLKKEWRRVKRGELAFWLTKWLSLATFLVALGCSIVYGTNHLAIAYVP